MKNIVITGANRGIGLELTKLFGQDHTVYAICRSDFPQDALNDRIKVVKLDITDEPAITKFAAELNNEQIAIDLLINNAGMAGGDENEVVKVDATSVTEVFVTNVVAPMMVSLHLAVSLKRTDKPVMIALSSRMGTHALLNDYNAEWWPYSSSKAALGLAVSAFAINEAAIKSISIHPGWVKTRMGGADAEMEPADSARDIKRLYEAIGGLESGKMYNHDGHLMDW
jgi:NAD(P)-dependent dehydrogenase (short-subunit alcohol dehydrogenase family)